MVLIEGVMKREKSKDMNKLPRMRDGMTTLLDCMIMLKYKITPLVLWEDIKTVHDHVQYCMVHATFNY